MSASNEVTCKVIVIMGVSGAGKSEDSDMRQGIALSDEDRIPWLENLQESLRERLLNGETVVLTCSSLKKKYREILRVSKLDYKQENYSSCKSQIELLQSDDCEKIFKIRVVLCPEAIVNLIHELLTNSLS
ncbi:hypothetical protein N665_1455s0001 [Sinapis alba]|nr:hypothetical protein N665_1455s0001 [Sinapis alba]